MVNSTCVVTFLEQGAELLAYIYTQPSVCGPFPLYNGIIIPALHSVIFPVVHALTVNMLQLWAGHLLCTLFFLNGRTNLFQGRYMYMYIGFGVRDCIYC